jgi:hypothetical protein
VTSLKLQRVIRVVLVSLVVAVVTGCVRQAKTTEDQSASSSTTAKPPPTVEPTPHPTANSPIRDVDFVTLGFGGPINYGDVTGDGEEEAMMDQAIPTRGSAIPYRVYIYTLRRGRPKLVWRFEAGDRGEGGLRSVYADNGDLIVELYGRSATAEDPYASAATSAEDGGACCPRYFTRTRYEWKGRRFSKKGEPEILRNPDQGAPTRMYRASIKSIGAI